MRGTVAPNTLAHANETRDWRIYADFARVLIDTGRELYRNEPFALEVVLIQVLMGQYWLNI